MRRSVCRLLGLKGYACDEAADGVSAHEQLKASPYDVLICDVDMPGNEDLRLIATAPQLQTGLPVIVITGVPTLDSAVRSLRLAVAAYLIKPFTPEELLTETAKAVERRQFHLAVAQNRGRLQQICTELQQVEAGLEGGGRADLPASANAYLTITFRNAAQSLAELRRVLELMNASSTGDGDSSQHPSRVLVLLQTLSETVSVIEKTKSSFKSKELAELRRKIQALLKD
ncbi:MAG: response regulator [Verrucomicrobiales bacterium]|nr:response regulator [Verrucomicrobiales bacterium]